MPDARQNDELETVSYSLRSTVNPNLRPSRGFHVRRFVIRSTALVVVVLLLGWLLLRVESDTPAAVQAIERDQLLVGAWLGDWPGGDNKLLTDFEETTDARLDLLDIFIDWFTPIKNVTSTIEYVHSQGKIPILTWEPHDYTTVDIVEGDRHVPLRDGRFLPIHRYINEFAEGTCKAASKTEIPVFMRPIHEMNGGWFSWGTGYQDRQGARPNSDDSYRAAWRLIHHAFESRCGDQIRWVWAVNHYSTSGTSWMDTYPGSDYVDYVGIDGYNWGDRASWGWQSFDTVFHDAYCAVTKGTDKPVLIAEVGSTEQGGDKADWIQDAFEQVVSGKYPRVRGMVWFNDPKFEVEIKGPMDWPIDSSPAATAAFRQSVQAAQTESAKMPPLDFPTDVCS